MRSYVKPERLSRATLPSKNLEKPSREVNKEQVGVCSDNKRVLETDGEEANQNYVLLQNELKGKTMTEVPKLENSQVRQHKEFVTKNIPERNEQRNRLRGSGKHYVLILSEDATYREMKQILKTKNRENF